MTTTISGAGTIGGLVAGGLPDASITQPDLAAGVVGNGPAFSAYQSGAQYIAAGANNKVQFQSEEFDTANCFDSTTNYRFTPNVAGYYHFTAEVGGGNAVAAMVLRLYKNGSVAKVMGYSNSSEVGVNGSALIYMNGSTDYAEIYYETATNVTLYNSADATYFQGFLARAA